jgi:hypothetical protein
MMFDNLRDLMTMFCATILSAPSDFEPDIKELPDKSYWKHPIHSSIALQVNIQQDSDQSREAARIILNGAAWPCEAMIRLGYVDEILPFFAHNPDSFLIE